MKYLNIITIVIALSFAACGGGEEASVGNDAQKIKKELATIKVGIEDFGSRNKGFGSSIGET
ncbi:MAG: hypothetical protein HC803_02010 [Saprospiraceae bacterium]|nr:hypothetical protein [Saprospiraceae bacterium]